MKDAAQSLQQYALEQTAMRLGRVAFEIRRTRRKADDEAVHDLRVSIRRFTQALRVFQDLLPAGQARKIRKRLRSIMTIAGEVRNLDIAREMAKESGIRQAQSLPDALGEERRDAERRLKDALRRLYASDFSDHWRQRLELNPEK
jgi:CHAD domain-containing protein